MKTTVLCCCDLNTYYTTLIPFLSQSTDILYSLSEEVTGFAVEPEWSFLFNTWDDDCDDN